MAVELATDPASDLLEEEDRALFLESWRDDEVCFLDFAMIEDCCLAFLVGSSMLIVDKRGFHMHRYSVYAGERHSQLDPNVYHPIEL